VTNNQPEHPGRMRGGPGRREGLGTTPRGPLLLADHRVAPSPRHCGPRSREHLREPRPEAASGPRDESDVTRQIGSCVG
jgi:hypothetical protein